MKIRLVVPGVNVHTTDRLRSCHYCKGAILQRHGLEAHQGPSGHGGGGPPLQVSFVRPQDVSPLPVGSEFEESEPTHGGVSRAYVRARTLLLGGIAPAWGFGSGH